MIWLYYLLEANLYLVVFYGFYLIFLQKETFYGLNRGYLICSSLFSFAIPFLQIGRFNGLVYGNTAMDLVYINPNLGKMQNDSLSLASSGNIVVAVYLLIAVLFIIKLSISFFKIISLAIRARREKLGGIVYIELSSSATAFSFFNLLFINPSSTEKLTILKHEMVHIRQRHSLDILFFELLKILNWFNPIVWLIQKDIKLLHEYIADAVTTNSDVQKHEYAMFLIQNSFGVTPNYLTNQIFNQSILKRRINMLNKKRSAGAARLKILLTVPVVGGMLFASTLAFSKDYEMIDLYPEKYSVDNSQVVTSKPNQEPVAKKKRFKLNHKISEKTKIFTSYDNRLVVINGNSSQSGVIMEVEGYDKLVELNAKEATAKYGSGAASGALIFTGKNTKTLSVRDDIRFPPPIVVKDSRIPPPPKPGNKSRSRTVDINGEKIKFPPPAPRKEKKKQYRTVDANGQKIKFPPPIVVKDRPIPPPPPPIDPPKPEPTTENEQTKLEGTGQYSSDRN